MTIRRGAILCFSIYVFAMAGCSGRSSSGTEPLSDKVAAAYDPATATAKVFGSIQFEGTPPVMAPVEPAGSRFCVQNVRGLTDQSVLVTKDHKLENVIVYVRSGFEGRSYATPSEPVVLDQQRCVYVPHVFTMMTNQKLSVHNDDATFHNVHSIAEKNAVFNFAQPTRGGENTVAFTKAEMPIHIGCDLHKWMGTWVGVFDHPFHVTSGATGNYELKLPPGKYEIVAWHEKYGEKVEMIEVADKAQVPLNFTFAAKSGN